MNGPQKLMTDYSFAVSTRRLSAQLPVEDYIARFRRAGYFLELCRECRNFSRRYGCPPFDYDVAERISHYTTATIIGVQIIPEEKRLPLDMAQELMEPVIRHITGELLAQEKQTGGLSFGFAGGCMLCGNSPCARVSGQPCRHPDMVRPSLESYGFDLSRTAEELLGMPLLWSTDGYIPDYLMLICGIFT